ncbi:MAG: hypothetical protein DMG12_19085 [Acidobacteria bacterium]|nr:MAG: hypothetical protein DMG12_19085 [Acidobacteriota bacterium]
MVSKINHNGGVDVRNQNSAIEEEKRRYRRLQFLMDLTLNTIGQTPMTYDEALQLIQSAKDAALKLFPGEEQAFEMIYMSRFRRLIREIWGETLN